MTTRAYRPHSRRPRQEEPGSRLAATRRSFLDLSTKDGGIGAKAPYDLTPRYRGWAVSHSGLDSIRLGAADNPNEDDEELNNLICVSEPRLRIP